MRIVLDLQACQDSANPHAPAILGQALALARAASERHTMLLALAERDGADAVRAAFAGLVRPEDVVVFSLPPGDERVRELVRAGALAAHRPDVVWTPGFDRAEVCASIDTLDEGYACAVGLSDTRAFLETASGPLALRRRHACARAALVHAPDDAGRTALMRYLELPAERTVSCAEGARLLEIFERLPSRPAPAGRPRLAYVSPLPPARSGIADYSAELLPELSRYYDIDVVTDQDHIADDWVAACLPRRTSSWFDAHAHDYDRVLYHFGNSPLHGAMFALLARHPGVVVLHDFYLGNVLHHLEQDGTLPDGFLNALIDAHGYAGMYTLATEGREAAVWRYPSNKTVLDRASGVIVHSELPRRMAAQWYGPETAKHWRTIPLLRVGAAAMERANARAALGLREGEFAVCAFGMLGPTKLNDRLLDAWLASPLAQDPQCRLVFVGENDGGEYGRTLAARIAALPAPARVTITGFATPETYRAWLAAADAAVQLRGNTRGETSAAILDCLLAGLPTVVNAHGAASELPDDVLVKLPDACDAQELAQALATLRADGPARAALGQRARAYVRDHHGPHNVGLAYRDAIEHFAAVEGRTAHRRLLRALAPELAGKPEALEQTALAVAANAPPCAQRTLFIDISAVVQHDLKTGIQRVVRSVVSALLAEPPPGWRIEPVYSDCAGGPYRLARRFMRALIGAAEVALPDALVDDAPICPAPGDIFLGLDLLLGPTQLTAAQLAAMRRRGVRIHFVVYDILPLLRPDVFPPGTDADFDGWLRTVAGVADGMICISQAVADEVQEWLRDRMPQRATPLGITHFHLGADIAASLPTTGMPEEAQHVLEQVRARPTLLTVGTVEPRKGHRQALDAFDLLWQRGVDANLIIVGKQGWMMEDLASRVETHPELGKRLFWLRGVSDEMLQALYGASAALLAPSEGEGFGLPLIEAAQFDLPVVARGLPVFREVLGEHGYYFAGFAGADLANAVEDWLALHRDGKAPRTTGLKWLTWAESARQLTAAMLTPAYRHEIPANHALKAT